MTPQSGNRVSTSLSNNGLCWTVFARRRDTAMPAEGDDLQTVSLCKDPDDVSHCWILSHDKTEWRLISATLCGWRLCFVTDQLWFMTRIREEDCSAQSPWLAVNVNVANWLNQEIRAALECNWKVNRQTDSDAGVHRELLNSDGWRPALAYVEVNVYCVCRHEATRRTVQLDFSPRGRCHRNLHSTRTPQVCNTLKLKWAEELRYVGVVQLWSDPECLNVHSIMRKRFLSCSECHLGKLDVHYRRKYYNY